VSAVKIGYRAIKAKQILVQARVNCNLMKQKRVILDVSAGSGHSDSSGDGVL